MNTLGYYGIFLGLQYQNSVELTRQLDADVYDESQTTVIQVPITVPYMYNDADFKRAEGTFEYKGELYRVIKQKYENDVLTMIVLRDTENKRIAQALSDYAMTFADNAGDDSQSVKVTVSFIKEYLPQAIGILTSSNGWQRDVLNDTSAGNLIPTFSASVVHPPERA
jgi:hypothetical protein